jgi:hypothetical protein
MTGSRIVFAIAVVVLGAALGLGSYTFAYARGWAYAGNLVADAIRDIVAACGPRAPASDIVVVGNDAIPFFRCGRVRSRPGRTACRPSPTTRPHRPA